MAISDLRDYLYSQRRKFFWRYLFNRRFNFKHLNLDFFRFYSSLDFGIDYDGNRRMLRKFPKLSDLIQFYRTTAPLSIYISTHRIEEVLPFLESICDDFNGIVIIDPLDQSICERPFWLPKNAIWCAPHLQNATTSDGVCLPVGVTNAWMWQYGRASLFQNTKIKSKLVLSGPYGPTHNSRNTLNSSLEPLSFVDCFDERLSPNKYSQLASQYAFTLSPRGNGIDTHRFWESLYRGSIPIVNSSEWSSHFSELGITLLAVDSFLDLQQYSPQDLWSFYLENSIRIHECELLDPYFWLRKLELLTINHLQRRNVSMQSLEIFRIINK